MIEATMMKKRITPGWSTLDEVATLLGVRPKSITQRVWFEGEENFSPETERVGRRRVFRLAAAWQLHCLGIEDALLPAIVRLVARPYEPEDAERLESWAKGIGESSSVPTERVIPLWTLGDQGRVTLDFRAFQERLPSDMRKLFQKDLVFKAVTNALLEKVANLGLWLVVDWPKTESGTEIRERNLLLSTCLGVEKKDEAFADAWNGSKEFWDRWGKETSREFPWKIERLRKISPTKCREASQFLTLIEKALAV